MKSQHIAAYHLVLLVTRVLSFHLEGKTYDSDTIDRYAAFKKKYAISFDSMAEDAYRLEVFTKNVMFIEETNRRNLSYTLEVNEFAAMTQGEFAREKMASPDSFPVHSVDIPLGNEHYMRNDSLEDFPSDLSWVERGAVNSPIPQGPCDSCYAIGTLGALEAACWAKTGTLPKLSVQQIVDCSREEGNLGCVTGSQGFTLRYIAKYGIVSDEDYPYEAKEQQCKNDVVSDKTKQYLKVVGYNHTMSFGSRQTISEVFSCNFKRAP
ncbi:hypothetical protein FOL47_009934 [Perkinsus chesapeaki]|uniref:Uncharacterized protein n=1 Tax=Perkinsus chesapeaki TaxID=330153 RepID=A0A7J6L5N7_PERCH|nr:hypothetical protein FOL47_009934 [Perkinsus chesapeaki]